MYRSYRIKLGDECREGCEIGRLAFLSPGPLNVLLCIEPTALYTRGSFDTLFKSKQ